MIIDGKAIASDIEKELISKTQELNSSIGIVSGEDKGALSYLKSIEKVAERVGIKVEKKILNKDNTTEDAIESLLSLDTDGILVLRPLPETIDERKLIESIPVNKDIDCLHPENLGRLFLGKTLFYPCTPLAVIEILKRTGVEIKGKDVVIIGRSNIVGKPLCCMLLEKGIDATVTVCHTKTKDLSGHARRADILIAACGKPKFITSSMVKNGAIVIDVGINVVDGKIVGDVDFEDVKNVASMITPVPNGVGPVTTRMLLLNVIKAVDGRGRIYATHKDNWV